MRRIGIEKKREGMGGGCGGAVLFFWMFFIPKEVSPGLVNPTPVAGPRNYAQVLAPESQAPGLLKQQASAVVVMVGI